MIHPNTELRLVDPSIGFGVFASVPIPKGTMVYVQDQLEVRIPRKLYLSLDKTCRDSVDTYSYINQDDVRILSWDIGKYVNHSCSPNCLSAAWGFEIAIRDIEAGEEITDDYGLFNIDWELECACGHKSCRRVINPEKAHKLCRKWDRDIRSAMSLFSQVKQPLLPSMLPSAREAVHDYLNGKKRYRSVRHMLKPLQAIDAVT